MAKAYFQNNDYRNQPEIGGYTFVFEKAGASPLTGGYSGLIELSDEKQIAVLRKHGKSVGVYELTEAEAINAIKKKNQRINLVHIGQPATQIDSVGHVEERKASGMLSDPSQGVDDVFAELGESEVKEPESVVEQAEPEPEPTPEPTPEPEPEAQVEAQEELSEPEPKPKKRKPGRPRKNQSD